MTKDNGNRDIRPFKALVTIIYAEYEDGEVVREFSEKEPELLYRREFGKLGELADSKTEAVQEALVGH